MPASEDSHRLHVCTVGLVAGPEQEADLHDTSLHRPHTARQLPSLRGGTSLSDGRAKVLEGRQEEAGAIE